MPYRVGAKGSYGCSGYPALKVGTNEVMGCHDTRSQASAQIYAINRSEGNVTKYMGDIKEGDFVMGTTTEGMIHGRVEHIMLEGGTYGVPGTEYAIESTPENPAMAVRVYEEEDGEWEPTAYSIGMAYADAQKIDIENHSMDAEETMSTQKSYEGCGCPTCKELNVNCENCPECNSTMKDCCGGNIAKESPCWDGYVQRGMKPGKNGKMVPNCVPVDKAVEIDKARMANAPYQDAQLDSEDSAEIEMAAKPNYEDMIKPRRGGSTPANPRLYARIVQEAKDKFDVYPSAVANGWVVQEYKRRGGTYKAVDMNTEKRDYSTDARERMAGAGTAMPDGSFPIANRADLQNAIQSVGRAKDYGKAKAHIISRARALNAMDMLPEDWRNMATKGMGQWSGSVFDLNPFVK